MKPPLQRLIAFTRNAFLPDTLLRQGGDLQQFVPSPKFVPISLEPFQFGHLLLFGFIDRTPCIQYLQRLRTPFQQDFNVHVTGLAALVRGVQVGQGGLFQLVFRQGSLPCEGQPILVLGQFGFEQAGRLVFDVIKRNAAVVPGAKHGYARFQVGAAIADDGTRHPRLCRRFFQLLPNGGSGRGLHR